MYPLRPRGKIPSLRPLPRNLAAVTGRPPKVVDKAHARVIAESVLSSALSQAPFVQELSAAWHVAGVLCDNWVLIRGLYEAYESKGPEGVANILDSRAAYDAASSVQREIAWAKLRPLIPEELNPVCSHIVSQVVDGVTEEEISLVRQLLR